MAVQDTGLILLGFATLRRGIISVRGASGCSALYHAPPWLLFHFRSIIFLNTCFDFAFKCLLNQLISALEYTPCHSTASAVTCGGSCPYLFKNDFVTSSLVCTLSVMFSWRHGVKSILTRWYPITQPTASYGKQTEIFSLRDLACIGPYP